MKIKKVLGLGQYQRKPWSVHWQGVRQGFTDLGYEFLGVESRENSIENMKRDILSFKPDFIFADCVFDDDFHPLSKMREFFKDVKQTLHSLIVYFEGDLRDNPAADMKGIIDAVFVSNREELSKYKKKYNVEQVHYLPAGCLRREAIAHYQPHYDFNFLFVGMTDNPLYEEKRNPFLREIKEMLDIKFLPDGNMPEIKCYQLLPLIYASTPIMLGADITDKVELFTSNRVFLTLGHGGFFLLNKVPGIEELFEDKKHLRYFSDYNVDEVEKLYNYYRSHRIERDKIRFAGFSLVQKKHTYTCRMRDVIDLTLGRIKIFRGYL